jgi:TolB protein
VDVGGTLVVTATGRMERGYTVSVAVTADGVALAPANYALSAQPADAAQVMGDGTVRLLRSGAVTLLATAPHKAGSAALTVAAPPVVVFDRFSGTNRDIWRVDLDGQNLTQLTTDTGDDQDPAVAGGKVVFVSYRSGNGELYSIPLAGGATTRLTNTARDETAPALSPDASKVAYAFVVTDITKLFTANPDGTNAVRATPVDFGFDGSIETTPTWTTGGKMAFVATVNGSADIFQVTGSGEPSLLVGGPQAEVEPAFSPDGKTLAFVSNRNGGTDIFLLNVSSGAVTQLTSGAGSKSQPAWTPDGRLVYLETLGGTRLRWVDPAEPATLHTIETGAGTVGHPAATAQ